MKLIVPTAALRWQRALLMSALARTELPGEFPYAVDPNAVTPVAAATASAASASRVRRGPSPATVPRQPLRAPLVANEAPSLPVPCRIARKRVYVLPNPAGPYHNSPA